MRTLTKLAICLALLTATVHRAHAQETFAPLISENCVAFIHVDFSKIDIDTVKAVLQETGESLLRELGFDQQSFAATARELAIELEKLDVIVRPSWETITKEIGITEIGIIFDMQLLEAGAPIFAIPWKNKTDKQFETFIETLVAVFGGPAPAPEETNFIKVDGFLLVAHPWVQAKVAEWVRNVTPASADSAIHEALKSVTDANIKIVATIPEPLRAMAQSGMGMPPDVPHEVRGLILFAATRVQWASASVSFSDVLSGEPRENSDVLLTIKTARPTDATMLRNMLEQLIEFGVNSARFMFEQEMRHQEFQIPPLAYSFAKGFLRTLLPDVEGDTLLFRAKGGVMSPQVTVGAVGMGVALLLPAVQAAREAARRMQCANNIKQIVLALHNHHDAIGALPPLYSVDANGRPLHSWRVQILPYIEQIALYDAIRHNEPWDSEYNKQFHDRMPAVFGCPSNPGRLCTYAVIAGEVFVPATTAMRAAERHARGNTFAVITDGTSNTLAVVEVREAFNWMDPTKDVTLDELVNGFGMGGRVGSYHMGGMNVGLFDGSGRFISETIDRAVLRALGARASGTFPRSW